MSEQTSSSSSPSIFRQSALDRLSSPEQLDRAIRITSPRDWIGAFVLCVFLGAGAVWSVYGSVHTQVGGSGILIATGGRLSEAFALGEGVVSEIFVKVGDVVAEGERIASLSQPGIVLAVENARLVIDERRAQVENRERQVALFTELRQENIAARKRAIDERLRSAEDRIATLQKQLANEEPMFQQRLITWQRLQQSRQDLATARESLFDARSQMIQVEAEELNARHADERDLQRLRELLAEAERDAGRMRLQLEQRDRVLSPAAGRVTEIKAAVGSRTTAGMPIVSIESGVTGLQLLVYLPPDQGKQVKPGMDVRISPTTVKREEYGTMVGRVLEVSDFPASAQAMLVTLGNERLVQQFSARGAPIAARVDLVRDASRSSGYRWSGGSGPASRITSGTIATAEVTVREAAPISFLLPMLRRLTGTDG